MRPGEARSGSRGGCPARACGARRWRAARAPAWRGIPSNRLCASWKPLRTRARRPRIWLACGCTLGE
uniref:Uncharacterized protein n=1 Tax=Setaria italica TaxID=4555 RepID=K3ZPM2_SETIT